MAISSSSSWRPSTQVGSQIGECHGDLVAPLDLAPPDGYGWDGNPGKNIGDGDGDWDYGQ